MNEQEQQQIEEAPIVEPVAPPTTYDHMPLKDQFSSDLSQIDLGDYGDKQEEQMGSQKVMPMKPKKKKIVKNYRWKHKWVNQTNIISGAPPLWIKKWVRVKYVPNQDEVAEGNEEEQGEKDKGTLELAHAIILEQMNNS